MTLRIFTEFIWLSIQNGVAGLLWPRNEPSGSMKGKGFRASISLSRNILLHGISYVFLFSPLLLHVQVIFTSSFHHFHNFFLSK
jgi:hypothetical protein